MCASPPATHRVAGRADRCSVCLSPATRERLSERLSVAHICEGILPSNIAELAEAGAELRNLSAPSHPEAFTVEMAASMLESTHSRQPPLNTRWSEPRREGCCRVNMRDLVPRPETFAASKADTMWSGESQ